MKTMQRLIYIIQFEIVSEIVCSVTVYSSRKSKAKLYFSGIFATEAHKKAVHSMNFKYEFEIMYIYTEI